jgi:muramoyltetrapeptide carboxypeptidase
MLILVPMNMIKPPYLVENDVVWIVSPAKFIDEKYIIDAVTILESWGLQVNIGKHCLSKSTLYAGSDQDRLLDFQCALNDKEAKAVFCARGGYGSIRIINDLDWSFFIQNPKWIVGFSDITVFHSYLNNFLNTMSIHGTMPLNFIDNSKAALSTLYASLFGNHHSFSIKTSRHNIQGKASGVLVGGNLSVFYSLLGTHFKTTSSEVILFIEDLTEMKYHIDRMLYSMEYSDFYNSIKGVVVGSFTHITDGTIPFEKTVEDIILTHFSPLNIPVLFDFPAGHIPDNQALVFGAKTRLSVTDSLSTLTYEGI